MKNERQKTNSVTDLVKIVAREVAEEVFTKKMNDDNFQITRSGTSWSREEDELLRREVKFAVENIALAHRRTYLAIVSRINTKQLIDMCSHDLDDEE